MKVIILAGGYGTRLGNITGEMPKPMVRIGNKPILWHIMKTYAGYNFKDFILCLGYKQEVIKQYFHNYYTHAADYTIDLGSKEINVLNSHDEMDWKVSMIDTGLDTLKGGRIKKIEKYLDDDINLLTYGDGVADINIDELIKFHKSHGKTITITGVRPPSRFGEITEQDSKLVFKEKPQASSGLINGGFFVFNKKLCNFLTEEDNCDLEHGVFEKLAELDEIRVFKHLGQWECVDTERDLNHLNKLWHENKAFWKNWK
jgi:glucose-1-phosphate cytidylyltransferase